MKTLAIFFGKTKDAWLKLGILTMGLFSSVLVFADANDPQIGGHSAGDVAQKLQTEAGEWKTFLWTGAQVAGIIITLIGIMTWVKAAKNHTGHSHGKAITLIVIGALCFFLSTLMGGAATSIFGD